MAENMKDATEPTYVFGRNTIPDLARELVALDEQKKMTESRLAVVKERIEEVKERLLEDFEKSGVNSISVDGATVFLSNTIRITVKDWDKATEALRQLGQDEMIQSRANLNTLSAWARLEIERTGTLPPVCDGVIVPFDDFDVRIRRK